MEKNDLFVGDVVVAAGYTNPQQILALKDGFVVLQDTENKIQGSQSYENIFEVLKCGASNKEISTKASEKQVAGNHYAKLKIQPMRYALENDLNYAQANAVKYITRYKDKNGIEDLKKAIHCIELLIEFEEEQC